MTDDINVSASKQLSKQVLSRLGIQKPTGEQADLVESLLVKSIILHELSFHHSLTEREVSCLLLAAKGGTMEEAAKILNVKYSTIETWYKKIKRKLASRSMAQAVYEGIRHGYISQMAEN